MAFLFDLPEFPFQMKITGFGKKIWKRLTTIGTKKVNTFCFTTFIFRRNTKQCDKGYKKYSIRVLTCNDFLSSY